MSSKLRQHIFDQLFEPGSTKGKETKLRMVEAAIESFATVGVDKTTYESIAKLAGTSKQLVKNYFPDKQDLFVFSVKYIRALFQKYAIAALKERTDPKALLISYLDATLLWVKEYRKHATVWALFLYYCGVSPTYQDLHTQLVEVGHDRLIALISMGKRSKVFRCKNPALAAKMIQAVITGSLITIATEDLGAEASRFESAMVNLCLTAAGANEE